MRVRRPLAGSTLAVVLLSSGPAGAAERVRAPAIEATSIQAAGRYFAEHEPDLALRARAVHDYVALRTRYDYPALAQKPTPEEDGNAEWVFDHRRGICLGYARLFTEIGRAAGLTVATIHGSAGGGSHAWNAVWIEGSWHSVDVTWDRVDHPGKDGAVRDTYFMPDEGVFARDHVASAPAPSPPPPPPPPAPSRELRTSHATTLSPPADHAGGARDVGDPLPAGDGRRAVPRNGARHTAVDPGIDGFAVDATARREAAPNHTRSGLQGAPAPGPPHGPRDAVRESSRCLTCGDRPEPVSPRAHRTADEAGASSED
jgi:hypothetical protein